MTRDVTDATRICYSYLVPQTRRRVFTNLQALACVHATNLKQKLLQP